MSKQLTIKQQSFKNWEKLSRYVNDNIERLHWTLQQYVNSHLYSIPAVSKFGTGIVTSGMFTNNEPYMIYGRADKFNVVVGETLRELYNQIEYAPRGTHRHMAQRWIIQLGVNSNVGDYYFSLDLTVPVLSTHPNKH